MCIVCFCYSENMDKTLLLEHDILRKFCLKLK